MTQPQNLEFLLLTGDVGEACRRLALPLRSVLSDRARQMHLPAHLVDDALQEACLRVLLYHGRFDPAPQARLSQRVAEMMPLAKGVSVKPRVWDFKGNSSDIDLAKMMKIVVDAGYRGHCGIEYGPEGNELDGVRKLREQLEAVRKQLSGQG